MSFFNAIKNVILKPDWFWQIWLKLYIFCSFFQLKTSTTVALSGGTTTLLRTAKCINSSRQTRGWAEVCRTLKKSFTSKIFQMVHWTCFISHTVYYKFLLQWQYFKSRSTIGVIRKINSKPFRVEFEECRFYIINQVLYVKL